MLLKLIASKTLKDQKLGRAKKTTEDLAGVRLPSVPFPWSLAVHHQSLAFRAILCHAKNEAPEEEAGEMRKQNRAWEDEWNNKQV